MINEQRLKIALRVAELAVESGLWTNETGLEFCRHVDRGLVCDETLEAFRRDVESDAQEGES